MSYIRCLSNPESLYVVGTTSDLHTFSWTDRNDEMQMMNIPSECFDEFFTQFRKWEEEHDLWDEMFECKGIRLRTVSFDEELKRILTDDEILARHDRRQAGHIDRQSRVNYLICLTYEDNPPLLMWEVTWDRLRNSAYDHLFWPCWFVRKINRLFGCDYRL